MLVLLLSLAIFAFFALLGQAAIAGVNFRLPLVRSWLLSPAVGLSLLVLIVTPFNQAGLPVQDFAPFLFIALLIAAAGVFWWRRPVLPTKKLLPYVIILVGGLLYAGWPALKYGFNWLSYANDDMANYCLAAIRLLHNGFYRVPTLQELGGTDYSQYFWFMHAVGFIRFGSEMLLAFVAAVAGKSPVNIFMATILALALVQICAASALVLHKPWLRRHALLTALFLAASPLFILGTLYQLIAQVGGIALMLAVFAALTHQHGRTQFFRQSIIAALLAACLCIFYPETTPFVFLGYGLYVILGLFGQGRRFRSQLVIPLVIVALILLFLRENIFEYLITLLDQTKGGLTPANLAYSLFPFFLVPSGMAYLFGLLPIPVIIADPLLSILIATGAALLVFAWVVCLIGLKKFRPFACLLAVFLALSIFLFYHGNDFGLYKLAQYIQPLLLAALTYPLLKRSPALGLLCFAVFIALTYRTVLSYTNSSLGEQGNGFTELKHVSELGIRRLVLAPGQQTISDLTSPTAIKLMAASNIGSDIDFVSRNYFANILDFGGTQKKNTDVLRFYPHQNLLRCATALMTAMAQRAPPDEVLAGSAFSATPIPAGTAQSIATISFHDTLINAIYPRSPPSRKAGYFTVLNNIDHPYLIFKQSSLGNSYFLGDRRIVSFYQIESDYFDPAHSFAGIGRFLLFQVADSANPIYLHVALSRSLMGAGRTKLPANLIIHGATEQVFHLSGDGAASVFLGPITPWQVKGQSYIALDLGQPGLPFHTPKTGLMKLYYTRINLDPRRLVAFGRDISAVTPNYVEDLPRPTAIEHFPGDLLAGPGVEFSGIYEDGWISSRAFIVLGEHPAGAILQIKGQIPGLEEFARARQTLIVTINGSHTYREAFPPGDFTMNVPLLTGGRQVRVEFSFSEAAALPSPDDRPVAAQLKSIRIERAEK